MSQQQCHDHIFELFLFVNPIDSLSLELEKEILKFAEESPYEIYYRFICFQDFENIRAIFERNHIKINNINDWNYYCKMMFSIALGYKTALLQGKKQGHHFLMIMQETFGKEKKPFSKSDSLKLIDSFIDIEMFLDDFYSKQVENDYEQDIATAHQMHIHQVPSLVIFDSLNADFGLQVHDVFSSEDLYSIVSQMALCSDHKRKGQSDEACDKILPFSDDSKYSIQPH